MLLMWEIICDFDQFVTVGITTDYVGGSCPVYVACPLWHDCMEKEDCVLTRVMMGNTFLPASGTRVEQIRRIRRRDFVCMV